MTGSNQSTPKEYFIVKHNHGTEGPAMIDSISLSSTATRRRIRRRRRRCCDIGGSGSCRLASLALVTFSLLCSVRGFAPARPVAVMRLAPAVLKPLRQRRQQVKEERRRRYVSCCGRRLTATVHRTLERAASTSSSASSDSVSWEDVLLPHHQIHHEPVTATEKAAMSTGLLCAVAAIVWIVTASGAGAWRYYLAGGICAAASHAVPVPIDVVKTRKQVDPDLQDMSFPEATRYLVRREGLRTLLAGLGPTTVGYLLEGALKFGVYEILKPAVRNMLLSLSGTLSAPVLRSQTLAFVVCGTVSGLAASVALCPMEALRIRMVAEPEFAAYGWIEGGFRMLKYEGISGLWKGLVPMACKQVPYTITKNVSFDLITKRAYQFIRGRLDDGLASLSASTMVAIPTLSAAAASILACVSSQPGDMLLSLANAHEDDDRSTLDIVRDIMRSPRGASGFFVGIKARFLHVGIIVTLQLLIYDLVKRLVGIAATGSV